MRLISLVLLPLVAAGLMAVAPRRALRPLAILTGILTMSISVMLFSLAGDGVGLTYAHSWAPVAGLTFSFVADGVSSALLVLNGLLFTLAFVACGTEADRRPRLFFAMMLVTEAGAAGVFLARDMVLFYVFWEAVLLPLFVLISVFGEGRRQYSAVKLVIYSGLGSLAMLLSILALYLAQSGPGTRSFSMLQLPAGAAHLGGQSILPGLSGADLVFVGFALAFAIKSPIFPLHGWLADAYTSAPTPVVMVLAGVVSKLGPYGFYRVAIGLLPHSADRFRPLLVFMAAIGIVYAALLALRQTDAKRVLAYLSLSHMCFITLGIAGMTVVGMEGGVLQMLNHGILIASLFFIVGHLDRYLGTRDLGQVGGLSSRAPALAALFLVLALATLGLPGLNGFVGEYLIMLGTFSISGWLLALAAAGVVLAAWYTLRLYQGLMTGARSRGPGIDIGSAGAAVLVPLAAFAVVLGVYPAPVMDVVARSISLLVGAPVVSQ